MIQYASLTNTGDRELNEDYLGIQEDGGQFCFVVADGLGGHSRGEVASHTVVESVLEQFCQQEKEDACKLNTYFESAQEALLDLQKKEAAYQGMLTTMNILYVSDDKIVGGHIGDTRTYYFQDGKFISRTIDHSVPQMLVSAGEIKESQIRGHCDRNRLLKVMGMEWPEPPYVLSEAICPAKGQAFLLCTDGFWEHVLEKKMIHTLKKSKSPKEWLEMMEKFIRKGKKDRDNYSAIAVWVE